MATSGHDSPGFSRWRWPVGVLESLWSLAQRRPFLALETRLHLLRQEPGSDEVWTRIHGRIEGGSVGNADMGNGRLDNMRLTQLYVQAGNIVLPDVTWQLGTLQTWMGDLGLYDMRPSTLFDDTVGLSGHWQKEKFDVLVGLGDAGYARKGARYNTIFSGGVNVRVRPVRRVEMGLCPLWYEPKVVGNHFAPHSTRIFPTRIGYAKRRCKIGRWRIPTKPKTFPTPSLPGLFMGGCWLSRLR